MPTFENNAVAQVFSEYQPRYRKPLLRLRSLLLKTARETEGVGTLEETLKWGQPSYLTSETKAGTTVRMDWFEDNKVALFFSCQTTLVESFRGIYGDSLSYSKNRAIVFDVNEPLPEDIIRQCLQKAMRYHLDKKSSSEI